MRSNILIAAAAALPLFIVHASAEGTHGHHGASETTENQSGEMKHAAHAIQAGDLRIRDPWARAMLPGQPAGGGYLVIENTGTDDDTLVSLASPRAGKVEVHTMEMNNDVMVMRPVEGGLAIPAGETVTLEPGGLHIMFMQVEKGFQEGETVPVTLEFERAGKVDLELKAGPARGGMSHSGHDH
ncbi:copper chaperone PCu(A)C [uncultured Nitratireductor sp.]|uniref:copper chaperone PCu(A)C n=1 Tax=uncultured Nitratireductor sp. TaxID=520953 RepID=UPI0025FF5FFF|nr:copper chaperone PCu(A)C [uncultured Nitratireductor sp.]